MMEGKVIQGSEFSYEVQPAKRTVVMHVRNVQTKWEICAIEFSVEQAKDVAELLVRMASFIREKND